LAFSRGGHIMNNTISSCWHGIEWWGGDSAGTDPVGLSDLTINNNTVTSIARGCIWGSNGTGVNISGNTVNGCGDAGIGLEGTFNSTVTNNLVSNAANGAITTFYGSSNDTISNNFIIQPGSTSPGWGMHFYGRDKVSSGLTVSGNTIHTAS